MNYCKDCKHQEANEYSEPDCILYMTIEKDISLLYGESFYKKYSLSCREAREDNNKCGIYAKFFKPSLWYKIKIFIKGE